jgi:hypothetical protein
MHTAFLSENITGRNQFLEVDTWQDDIKKDIGDIEPEI